MDTKNNKMTSTTYRAYYNIYGMIIYKVFIDYIDIISLTMSSRENAPKDSNDYFKIN